MPAERAAAAAMRLEAWAKVNLTLHVTGRRPDGYHELDSLVVFAGVGDTLEITAAEDLSLSLEGPFASALDAAESNLALRAARSLREGFGATAGARLRLVKRLPVAAGLGGGSADAAAALRGLAHFWALGAPEDALHEIAARLGADVPACLTARPSLLSGVGELVQAAPPLPGFWLVLVNPGVPLSTPAVFKARGGPFSAPQPWTEAPGTARELAVRLAEGRNDLEAPAIALVPAIAQVLSALRATPACLLARMSGSGATCFGLYETEAAARAAARRLGADQADWWVAAAPAVRDSA